jgi:hypothetical protein
MGHDRTDIYTSNMCGQSALGVLTPRGYGPFGLGRFTENEANKDVETADGEQEEGSDEGECVYMMGEDRSADATRVEVRKKKG